MSDLSATDRVWIAQQLEHAGIRPHWWMVTTLAASVAPGAAYVRWPPSDRRERLVACAEIPPACLIEVGHSDAFGDHLDRLVVADVHGSGPYVLTIDESTPMKHAHSIGETIRVVHVGLPATEQGVAG